MCLKKKKEHKFITFQFWVQESGKAGGIAGATTVVCLGLSLPLFSAVVVLVLVVGLDHSLPDQLGEEGDSFGSKMQVRAARDRGAKPSRLLFPCLVPSELEAGRAASTCDHIQPPAWLPSPVE